MSSVAFQRLKSLEQDLYLVDQKSPYHLYQRTAEFFDELAKEVETPLTVALVARDSWMILPFLSHPQPPLELQPFRELVQMTTVYAMQRYRLGSIRHVDPEDDFDKNWLFDIVTDPKVIATRKFVRFIRDKKPFRLTTPKDMPLREYSGTYELAVPVESREANGGYSVFMPHYGHRPQNEDEGEAGRFIDEPKAAYFQDCQVRAIRYAAHQTGAEVFLLIALPTSEPVDAEMSELVCNAAITGAFALVDELRRQVSTANPRYVARYFQVKLGMSILERFSRDK